MDSAGAPRRGRPRFVAAIVLAAAVTGAALIAVGSANAGTVPAGGTAAAAPLSETIEPLPSSPTPAPVPPSAPTNLVATDLTTHSVTLTWTASTAGCCQITGYLITSSRPFTDVPGGPSKSVGNVTTAVLDGLSPTGQFSIGVRAVDSLGRYSAVSNIITLTAPISDEGDNVPPSAPTNLTLTASTLNWQPSIDNVGVTGYRVYRFDGWYTSALLTTVTGTSYVLPPTATSSPGPSGGRWVFYVRAIDAAGNVSVATGTVPGSTVPPVSPSPTPGDTCTVTYTNVSQWPHGFIANVTITNNGATPVAGWRLGFTFGGDQRITSASNATFSQSGAAATLRNTNHDAVIPPAGSVTVRINGNWHSSNAAPASFRLNGAPCANG
jgi:hypothetical protein